MAALKFGQIRNQGAHILKVQDSGDEVLEIFKRPLTPEVYTSIKGNT